MLFNAFRLAGKEEEIMMYCSINFIHFYVGDLSHLISFVVILVKVPMSY